MAGTVFGAATVIGASIELQAPCRWRLQQVSDRQADKHVSGWGPGVASVTRHSPVRETESSVQRSVRRYDLAATDLAWRIFAMWQARWAVELLGTGEGTGSGDDVLGVVKHGVKADSIGLEPARPRRDFETVWTLGREESAPSEGARRARSRCHESVLGIRQAGVRRRGLSERDKQRIGVGVALTTQCPYYAKARGPVSDAAWAGRGRSEVSRSAPRATGTRSGGYPSHF